MERDGYRGKSYELDMQVVGDGEVGEKVRELRQKERLIHEAGFVVPRRVVVGSGFLERFLARNRIGWEEWGPEVVRRVVRGSWAAEDYSQIEAVCGELSSAVVAVRSSAMGDARGTGVYRSDFVTGVPGEVRKGIQRVLASHFSESAYKFRRDAGFEPGMGIIVEEMVGQWITDYGLFGPIISGFGYSSTPMGEGYICVVPGVGGGVETRDALKIERGEYARFMSLGGFILGQMRNRGVVPWARILRTDRVRLYASSYTGMMWDKHFKVVREHGFEYDDRVLEMWWKTDLKKLFDGLAKLEKWLGSRQYVEWAMTARDGEPVWWVLQIADARVRSDNFDFDNVSSGVVLEGHTVVGSGKVECQKVIYAENELQMNTVRRLNEENANYLLLYNSHMISAGRVELVYADISNAAAIVEVQNRAHVERPAAHFGGMIETSGKLFGVLGENVINLENRLGVESESADIFVASCKLVMAASERHNRFVVYRPNN